MCICQELSLVKSSPTHQNTIKGILLIFLITDCGLIYDRWFKSSSWDCVQNILNLASWLGFRIF